MKLLLTSVFGPYGVDDEYGKKDNKMELFHNQITREQGIFSYRFNHNSFGLFFLAENVDVPTSVLDFSTLESFIDELGKGYDYVGISFIMPNFKKAKKMAEITREVSPKSKIILGGHGVNVPNVESLIEHDYICKGDGVNFLRNLFGEDPDRPIVHPIVHSSFNRRVMGVPLASTSGVLIPGVGCPNKCRFCATSHFFSGYTAYLATGRELFDVCCKYEEELGVTDFGVLDENFLKMKDRALELMFLMEENNRFFTFAIFSSAETLKELGDLDLLVRLGVTLIWLGVESKREVYAKNKDVDFYKLVKNLRERGISVLASSILFLEHHDKQSILEDMDFAISLNTDYLQFMQLGPIPGTTLYQDYQTKGKLLKDVPYEEQHGQDRIWFSHEHFTREETSQYLKMAFNRDYLANGASFLRAISTILMGYEYSRNHNHPVIRKRTGGFCKQLTLMRYFLPAIGIFKENDASAALLKEVKKKYREFFGRPPLKTLLISGLVLLYAMVEKIRIKYFDNTRQPQQVRVERPARFSPQYVLAQQEQPASK